jgi:hypothetical protein
VDQATIAARASALFSDVAKFALGLHAVMRSDAHPSLFIIATSEMNHALLAVD